MRIAAVGLCAVLAAGTAQGATFYYVGGVYDFANVPTGETPQFTVGEMTIDETKLPAGQGLSGLSFGAYENGTEGRAGPDYFSLRLSQNNGDPIYNSIAPEIRDSVAFSFDEAGVPSYWDVSENDFSGTFFNGNRGDGSIGHWYGNDTAIDPTSFLVNRGYKPGTKRFEELKASHEWEGGYTSRSGGAWYSDALEFAAAVGQRALQAATRGVSNIYSIPACRVAAADLEVSDYAPPVPA